MKIRHCGFCDTTKQYVDFPVALRKPHAGWRCLVCTAKQKRQNAMRSAAMRTARRKAGHQPLHYQLRLPL